MKGNIVDKKGIRFSNRSEWDFFSPSPFEQVLGELTRLRDQLKPAFVHPIRLDCFPLESVFASVPPCLIIEEVPRSWSFLRGPKCVPLLEFNRKTGDLRVLDSRVTEFLNQTDEGVLAAYARNLATIARKEVQVNA